MLRVVITHSVGFSKSRMLLETHGGLAKTHHATLTHSEFLIHNRTYHLLNPPWVLTF